jgi:hypothetical protein
MCCETEYTCLMCGQYTDSAWDICETGGGPMCENLEPKITEADPETDDGCGRPGCDFAEYEPSDSNNESEEEEVVQEEGEEETKS